MSGKVYITYENEDWFAPLAEALDKINVPYEGWKVNEYNLRLQDTPPEGIFYNRMSTSAHTRGHQYAIEANDAILKWLGAHDRRVINPQNVAKLEVSKFDQAAEFMRFGIPTPITYFATGHNEIIKAAEELGSTPFIVKPNRGGKGLGVQKFDSIDALKTALDNDAESFYSPDGINVIQNYINAQEQYLMRCEFIDSKFYYAVRVDNSEGFELCPADVCTLEEMCMIDGNEGDAGKENKFVIQPEFRHPYEEKFLALLQANNVEITAIESILDKDGNWYAYDLNTNTNYNSAAEIQAGIEKKAIDVVAEFLQRELSTEMAKAKAA